MPLYEIPDTQSNSLWLWLGLGITALLLFDTDKKSSNLSGYTSTCRKFGKNRLGHRQCLQYAPTCGSADEGCRTKAAPLPSEVGKRTQKDYEIEADALAQELANEKNFELDFNKKLMRDVLSYGGIGPHKSGFMSEEYKMIPKKYKRADGMPMDEVAQEMGVDESTLADQIYLAEASFQELKDMRGGKTATRFKKSEFIDEAWDRMRSGRGFMGGVKKLIDREGTDIQPFFKGDTNEVWFIDTMPRYNERLKDWFHSVYELDSRGNYKPAKLAVSTVSLKEQFLPGFKKTRIKEQQLTLFGDLPDEMYYLQQSTNGVMDFGDWMKGTFGLDPVVFGSMRLIELKERLTQTVEKRRKRMQRIAKPDPLYDSLEYANQQDEKILMSIPIYVPHLRNMTLYQVFEMAKNREVNVPTWVHKLKKIPESKGQMTLFGGSESLKHDVFRWNVGSKQMEVIKNPTASETRQISNEFKEKYPRSTESGIRSTYDQFDNKYVWNADTMHSDVEPMINMMWDVYTHQSPGMAKWLLDAGMANKKKMTFFGMSGGLKPFWIPAYQETWRIDEDDCKWKRFTARAKKELGIKDKGSTRQCKVIDSDGKTHYFSQAMIASLTKPIQQSFLGGGKKHSEDYFSPRQQEMFPGLRRELILEQEDSAGIFTVDPLDICLERKGWDIPKVRKYQQRISAKMTPDMFGKIEKLTGAEIMLQEQIQKCLERR